jgi:hypothetical protein
MAKPWFFTLNAQLVAAVKASLTIINRFCEAIIAQS